METTKTIKYCEESNSDNTISIQSVIVCSTLKFIPNLLEYIKMLFF